MLQLRVLEVGVSCLAIPLAGGVRPLRVGLRLHCAECHPEPSHKHLDNLLLSSQLLLLSSIVIRLYDVIRQTYFVSSPAYVLKQSCCCSHWKNVSLLYLFLNCSILGKYFFV